MGGRIDPAGGMLSHHAAAGAPSPLYIGGGGLSHEPLRAEDSHDPKDPEVLDGRTAEVD